MTCDWCGGGIIACPETYGYRRFCSPRHRDDYLTWVAGADRWLTWEALRNDQKNREHESPQEET